MRWTPGVVVTILVRGFGLLAAVSLLPGVALAALDIVTASWSGAPGTTVLRGLTAPAFQFLMFGASLYCFLSGRWLVARLLKGLAAGQRCAECGYDLSGISSKRCPECGALRLAGTI